MLDVNKNYTSLFGLIKDMDLDKTSWFILIHNLLPVIGVLFFGFDAGSIIFIYIAETIIIGILTVPRILLAEKNPDTTPSADKRAGLGGRLFIMCFFLVHYNAFNFGQITFIIPMIAKGDGSALEIFMSFIWDNEFMHYALLSVFVTHTVSLISDYIIPKVYKTVSPVAIMFLPYPRIFIQQFVAIFGGFVLLALDAPVILLIMLQVLKAAVEIFVDSFLKNPANKESFFSDAPPSESRNRF